jgi:hypothetical protein
VRFHVGVDVHSGAVGEGAGQTREVEATTFGRLAEMLPPPARYTLVSDIEGAEYDIFERDADSLAGARVAILEIHPRSYVEQGRSETSFLELSERVGFRLVERQADVVVLVRD